MDFNNWGHITGTYWTWSENSDSNISNHFGDTVSELISNILTDKNVYLPEYNKIIDEDKEIGTLKGLNYNKNKGINRYIFAQKKDINRW